MTNTERKRNGKHPTYKASFLLPPSSVINRPLLYPFDDCNWPRLVAIFHVRVPSVSYRDVTISNGSTTSPGLREVHIDAHLSSGMLFTLSKNAKRLNGPRYVSLSPSLTLSSLLRAVWKLNVKQSGTGEKGERETYGGAISWRGIDFYQDRGGGRERTLG